MKFVQEALAGAEVEDGSDTETVNTVEEENDPTPLYEQDSGIAVVIRDEDNVEDGDEPIDIPEPVIIEEPAVPEFVLMQLRHFGVAHIFHDLAEENGEDSDNNTDNEGDANIRNIIVEESDVETVNEVEMETEADSQGVSDTSNIENNHETEVRGDASEFDISTETNTVIEADIREFRNEINPVLENATSTDARELNVAAGSENKAETIPKTEVVQKTGIDG